MEAEDKNVSVFQGNAYYSVFDENSHSSKSIINLIHNVFSDKDLLDNSDKYILDLGGGNGYYGLLILKILKAKKVICYEPNLTMIEAGKSKFSTELDSIEYVPSKMEDILLNKTHLKHKYCCILVKEAIHFSNSDFFEKLLNFCDTNLYGKLLLLGAPNYKYWKKEPCLPKSAIKAIENINFDIIKCKDILTKKYNSNEFIKKIVFSLEEVAFKFTFLQYESFMINRSWSFLLKSTDLEIKETIENVKLSLSKSEKDEIIIDVTYAVLIANY
jgi:hypothetical protein